MVLAGRPKRDLLRILFPETETGSNCRSQDKEHPATTCLENAASSSLNTFTISQTGDRPNSSMLIKSTVSAEESRRLMREEHGMHKRHLELLLAAPHQTFIDADVRVRGSIAQFKPCAFLLRSSSG